MGLPAMLGAWAWTLAALAPAGYQGNGTIAGTVISISRQPVSKSVVRLDWAGPPHCYALARTGGDGRFRFDGLPPGSYTLSAAAPDGSGAAVLSLTLGAGESRAGVLLHPPAGASISGRVSDGDGDPLPDARVEFYRAAWRNGGACLDLAGTARTGHSGEYRMPRMAPGRYWVAASDGEWFLSASPPDIAIFPRVYYGGVRQWKQATPVELTAGRSIQDIDIRLVSAQMRVWTVHLRGLPEAGPASGRVVVLRGAPLDPPGAFSRFQFRRKVVGDGVLRWQASPGMYGVEIRTETGDAPLSAIVQVDLADDSQESSVTLAPPMELAGRIRMVGGGGAAVRAPEILLTPVLIPEERRGARAAADGLFVVRRLAAGTYRLALPALPAGAYLESAKLGEADARFGLDLTAPPEGKLEIVINRDGGTVDATVFGDERPAPGARVLLVSEDPKLRLLDGYYHEARAGAEGSAPFTGIPPGRYLVMALAADSFADGHDPELFENAAGHLTAIEVSAGRHVKVKLHLAAAAERQAAP